MDLTVKVKPTLFSIDKVLVKAGKRIRHASEDDLVDFWIAAADAYIEKRTNLALMRQTLVLRLGRVLPSVYLPRPPFASLVAVKLTPDNGVETVLDPEDDVALRRDAMLTIVDVPSLKGLPQNGTMEIEYLSGAAAAVDVPAPLRQASYLLAAHYLTSREASFMDPRLMQVEKKIAFGVDELVKEYRVPNVNEDLNGGW